MLPPRGFGHCFSLRPSSEQVLPSRGSGHRSWCFYLVDLATTLRSGHRVWIGVSFGCPFWDWSNGSVAGVSSSSATEGWVVSRLCTVGIPSVFGLMMLQLLFLFFFFFFSVQIWSLSGDCPSSVDLVPVLVWFSAFSETYLSEWWLSWSGRFSSRTSLIQCLSIFFLLQVFKFHYWFFPVHLSREELTGSTYFLLGTEQDIF